MTFQAAFRLAALCALTPVRLAAQDSLVHATIDSGTLVRMHPASGAPVRGRLVQPLGPSSTVVQFCRYPAPPCTNALDSSVVHSLPISSLTRLDVQRGSHWDSGAAIGGLIGGALGWFIGAFANGMCESSSGCGPPTAAYFAIGAATFGALGAFIGGGSPKWGPAP
jgi:hypothetical protein